MKDLKEFEDLMERFEEHCYLNDKAVNTIKLYKKSILYFRKYIEKSVLLATKKDILKFQAYLSDYKELSVNTVNTHTRGIKAFYAFLEEEGFVEENPSTSVKSKKNPKGSDVKMVSIDYVQKILKYLEESLKNEKDFVKKTRLLRDNALLHCLIYSGFRIGEICNLKIDDVGTVNNELRAVNDRERRTKNGRDRVVYVDSSCIEAIKDYVYIRKEFTKLSKNLKDDRYLFYTNHGNHMNERTANNIVKRIAKNAGVENVETIKPHAFRHTFASVAYKESEYDIMYTSRLLGHSSPKITADYLESFYKNESIAFSSDVFKGEKKECDIVPIKDVKVNGNVFYPKFMSN